MGNMIQLVGPNHTLQLFGVKLVGVNAESGKNSCSLSFSSFSLAY
jgi:hypothetical protein